MTPISTRTLADHAESDCLRQLHRFGYLTAPQVAALVYPWQRQGVAIARRTLHRLVAHGWVLARRPAVTVFGHYALSAAGARRVFDLDGVEAASGKDVLRFPSAHRDACNWAAIHMLDEGYARVWTEREIQTGRAPLKWLGQKVPDVLGVDQEGYCTWVEVEACRRGGRDMRRLVAWLTHTALPSDSEYIPLDPPRDSLVLRDVRFVLASESARTFPKRLEVALLMHGGVAYPRDWGAERVQFQLGLALADHVVAGFPEEG